MDRNKPTYSDHKELASNLRSLFLCCISTMHAALDSLVKAKRFDLKLEVSGRGNPGYALYVQVARQLGVRFEEQELPKTFEKQPFRWISDHTTKNLRAWIPEMKDREGDLHFMLPICFEHHVTELRKHDPAFQMPKVDNLYLLLIWSECFGVRQAPLSARVIKDTLAWESAGQISAYQYAGGVGDEIAIASSKAMALSPTAQMYMGFRPGQGGYGQCKRSGLVNHPFNVRTNKFLHATTHTGSVRTTTLPWMAQNYSWEADKVAVILKNAWVHRLHRAFGSPNDIKKTRECLELRLDGLPEDEIAKSLQFDDRKEYDKWLKERGLDTDSRAYRHPYEGWLTACEYFGVEPTPEVFESLVGTCTDSDQSLDPGAPPETEAGTATEPEEDDPIPGFRHSLDFRSLHLPNAQSLTLTEHQAQVVEILFLSLQNDTPELSQACIIEEVYPGVSEKRLRRQFGNNKLYDLLIESGSKRGLVKLRTHFE